MKGLSTNGKIAVGGVVVILAVLGLMFIQGYHASYGPGGPSGLIAAVVPKPVLSIGSVSAIEQGNVISGYTVPVSFVVSNSGNADATNVRATVTLLDSQGQIRGSQDVSIGTISPGGTGSGSASFSVGRIETLQGVKFGARIHVSSSEGATADYSP